MRVLSVLILAAVIGLVLLVLARPAGPTADAVSFWEGAEAPQPALAPRGLGDGSLRAVAIFDSAGDERPDLFLAGYVSDFVATQLPRGWNGQELASAGATRAALAVDLNRDGAPDLLAGGDQGLRLWLNDGRGHFRSATAPAGGSGVTTALAAADVNGDGQVDIFEARMGGPAHLWLNDGSAQPGSAPAYRDGTTEAGLDLCCELTVALLADLNADGNADLVVGGPDKPVRLFANAGRGRFTAMPFAPGRAANWRALAAGDFDHDGDLDLFIGAAPAPALAWLPAAWWRRLPGAGHILARNDGAMVFTDVAEIAGLASAPPASGAAWLDADNDGDLELLLAGPAGLSLWRVQPDGAAWTVNPVPGLAPATAVAVGDIDHNGYPDLVVRGPRGELQLALHKGGKNHWLAVRLRARGNAPVQGARVEVATRDGMRMSRQVVSGEGAGVDQFNALLFGLGRRAEIQGVSVFWPSGKFTRLERNNLDRYIGFVEPSDASGGRNVWLREPVLEALKKRPPVRRRLQCQ